MNENKQYQKGFNSGYSLAKHKPELYAELSKNLKPANDYVDGLIKGGKQYELELTKGLSQKKHDRKNHEKGLDLDKDRER